MKEVNRTLDNINNDNDIINLVNGFYHVYYKSNRLQLYSYLNTSFQREVPLNYFLIHPNYNIELGTLIEITKVRVEKHGLITAEITVEINNKMRDIVITAIKDFGGWKIDGDSIFSGNYS